ncbi:MAG: hypothetical protein PF503_25795 [Desulfobacula sp.]|jgi:hypothetical protein|nr:hypothetical protein [Desulfobacula sp.]
MAYEQIAVAGIQISQVMGNRQANISTEMEVLWRTMTNGMCAVLVCAAFCTPLLDGKKYKLEKLGDDPGVLSGIVDIRYLE